MRSKKPGSTPGGCQKPDAAGGGNGGNNGNNSMFCFIRERGTLDMGGMTALLFAARDGQGMDAARASCSEGGADINQVSASRKRPAPW